MEPVGLFYASRRPRRSSLRIIVCPHLNQESTEILVRDIEIACEYLKQHGGTATAPKLHDLLKMSAKC